ncbi:hypothetical protein KF728_11810 [Candidatus Obscuribacterales bacterium]|nr:hypothetical protein [Candidatus Obscuribacterales bacterium]MBX3150824.1 hypothetical protein [Candidatus Obscuribacterales bacterium]
MKAILCNDCGAIMSRFSNECVGCSRTNLSFHSDRHSDEFKKRTASIRASNTDYSRHFIVSGLLLGFLIVMAFGYHSSPKHQLQAAHNGYKTASRVTPATMTH